MMSGAINKIQPSKIYIDFSVGVLNSSSWGNSDDTNHKYSLVVSDATLSNGSTYLGGSYDFKLSQSSTTLNPCFFPLNTILTFTPTFSSANSNNNQIIQYKWNFGDGVEQLVLSPSSPPSVAQHSYNFNYGSSYSNDGYNNTSVIVSLTTIDQYQRHTRFSKVLYLKNYN
jgi:hypothetical protein